MVSQYHDLLELPDFLPMTDNPDRKQVYIGTETFRVLKMESAETDVSMNAIASFAVLDWISRKSENTDRRKQAQRTLDALRKALEN